MKTFNVYDKKDGSFVGQYNVENEEDLLESYDISATYFDIVLIEKAS